MPDPFESEYMAEADEVLYRDKRVARGMAALLGVWAPLCWALSIAIAFGNASSDQPLPDVALPFAVGGVALLGLVFGLLALTLAVMRTVVTATELIVKYGMQGPTVSLASIESCEVIDYDAARFGGWGIRGSGNTRAYVPGAGKVVEVRYTEEGETKSLQIGADDATQLRLAIDRARSKVRVRVEAEGLREDDELHEAEVEPAAANEPRELKARR